MSLMLKFKCTCENEFLGMTASDDQVKNGWMIRAVCPICMKTSDYEIQREEVMECDRDNGIDSQVYT